MVEFGVLAEGVAACAPPAGFWYLKSIASRLGADVPEAMGGALFAAAGLPDFEAAALLLCRSSRTSSVFVFALFVPAFGTAIDALCWGGIADLGVKGLVAVLRGSEPDLAADE